MRATWTRDSDVSPTTGPLQSSNGPLGGPVPLALRLPSAAQATPPSSVIPTRYPGRAPVAGRNKYFNSSDSVAIPPTARWARSLSGTRPLTQTRPHRLDQSVSLITPYSSHHLFFSEPPRGTLLFHQQSTRHESRNQTGHAILGHT
jgi:hypothetical protein